MIDYNEYFKDISSYAEFKMKVALLGKKISDKEILDCLPKVDDNYRYIIENGSPIWINKQGKIEDNPKIKIIDDEAFDDCNSLTSIIIPESVKSIESYAFWNCINLNSIKIPNSVKSIGISAFVFCSSLTSISIPNSVEYLGSWTFTFCKNLKTVYLPKHLKDIKKYFSDIPKTTKIIYT